MLIRKFTIFLKWLMALDFRLRAGIWLLLGLILLGLGAVVFSTKQTDYYLGIFINILSFVYTVLVLDTLVAYRVQTQTRERLIRQIASSNNSISLQALSEWNASEWKSGVFLESRNFDRSNLETGNLDNLSLKKSTFRNANLRKCGFFEASLRDAKLENANLEGAYLKSTDLRGANLKNASLRNAIFDEHTKFDETTILPSGQHYQNLEHIPPQLLLSEYVASQKTQSNSKRRIHFE